MRPALMLLLAAALTTGACTGSDTPPAAADAPAREPAAAPSDATDATGEAAPPAPAAPASTADAAATAPTVEDVAAAAASETARPAAAAEFDPASVPESSAVLPPFPFFEVPDGLVSVIGDREAASPFDREHMIAGERIVAVEGKVARDRFQLENPDQRQYSDIEFQRVYADAVAALGGQEISRTQYTDEVNKAFGGREAVDKRYHGTCASDGCENHTYLIRQGGKEWWIQVSTGAIPLHGEVVVLERQAMASKLGFIDAGAMKEALDADGRIALYIGFDTDKATLRADALPVIEEIDKLLRANPDLKLSIEGHTDATGTAERNRELSRQRADAVVAALVGRGIAADRLAAAGFGPDKPLVPETSDAARAKNRRVELVRQS